MVYFWARQDVTRNFELGKNPIDSSTIECIQSMAFPSFPPFDLHQDGNFEPRWKKWTEWFKRLLVAMDIKELKRQNALLLHYAGADVNEIHDTLTIPDPVRVQTIDDFTVTAIPR